MKVSDQSQRLPQVPAFLMQPPAPHAWTQGYVVCSVSVALTLTVANVKVGNTCA